jgi:autotransporter strand-loop-strand O-heptosyltransferase
MNNNSSIVKELYINSIESSNIIIRDKIEKPKLEILINFIDGPTIELKGKSEEKFNIEFYDSKDNLSYKTIMGSNMWSRSNKKYFQDWKIKINNDVIKYNAKGKRVYITLESRALGDNIAWIPYVEEFRKKHDAEVIVSTFWNKLFKGKYTNLKFIEPGSQVNNLYAMYKIGWFYNSDMEPEKPNTIPLQKTCSNILGLDFTEIKTEIDFKPSKRPIKEKYVCIATHSTAKLKHWNNKNGWCEVIDYLNSNGYLVYNLSLDKYDSINLLEPSDKSIESLMNWLHHSEFFIGLSSGLSWLSWSIGKHVVMISNFTEENHEFVSNCTRITNKSVCNSCWNNPNFKFDKGDWNWCPIWKGTDNQFECHTSITSDMVIQKIEKLLLK